MTSLKMPLQRLAAGGDKWFQFDNPIPANVPRAWPVWLVFWKSENSPDVERFKPDDNDINYEREAEHGP